VILVLAAGRGTRMGGPKALMTVGDQPWWVRQHRHLSQLGGAAKWIVSHDVSTGMASSKLDAPAPDRIVVDPTAPMFHSALAGILSIKTPSIGVFVLPIDVPAPNPETWLHLRLDPSIPHASIPSPPSPGVPTYQGKRGHPVFLPTSWIISTLLPQLPDLAHWNPEHSDPAIQTQLAAFRLDSLIEPTRTLVPVDDPGILTNLNTPADIQTWLSTKA
jgi:CTP:molybdopterin cytidylyltransferase MocA